MSGEKTAEPPANWAKESGHVYCLACRRQLAGEAATDAAPEDASADVLRKLEVAARIEFEIRRDPDVHDGQIAKACRTSIATVRTARERLGIPAG
jgi:hypothetical protein